MNSAELSPRWRRRRRRRRRRAKSPQHWPRHSAAEDQTATHSASSTRRP